MVTKKKTNLINPKRERLMPEKLRERSGLKLSDEQAKEVIGSITRYAKILFDFTVRQEQTARCKNKSKFSMISKKGVFTVVHDPYYLYIKC